MTRIEVFNAQGKLIAGDTGKSVSLLKLQKKMLKKGVDISHPSFNVVETDIGAKINERAVKVAKIKSDLASLPAGPIKSALLELVKSLR